MTWSGIKRRVFISHFKFDRAEVDAFIKEFSQRLNIFTPLVLGASDNDDFIESADTTYVMRRIRELYLKDSTVTVVLLGSCTHSRRYVDWEIKGSLQQAPTLPNGLIGIALPSTNGKVHLPPRLKENWSNDKRNCYARCWNYPKSGGELGEWIDDAYIARTHRSHLIKNPNDMMRYNRECLTHGFTH